MWCVVLDRARMAGKGTLTGGLALPARRQSEEEDDRELVAARDGYDSGLLEQDCGVVVQLWLRGIELGWLTASESATR